MCKKNKSKNRKKLCKKFKMIFFKALINQTMNIKLTINKIFALTLD